MRVACALVAVAFPIAIFTGGCGGASKQSTAAATTPVPDDDGPPPAPDGQPPAGAPDVPDAPDPAERLTEAQCNQMVDHMIDVQLAARSAEGDDAMPKPEAVEKIRGEIKADFVPQCLEQFTRSVFDCWLAAGSAAEFATCAGGREQEPAGEGA